MNRIDHVKSVAEKVVKQLQDAGHIAIFSGGMVRDKLIGRQPKDYDVATNALPDQVEALFQKTLAMGKAFGVIAVISEETTIEVATFRKDVGSVDGRHPETVSFCAAEEDALRRDFTINGMFYDPVSDELLDYVGGRLDLEKGMVRAIGEPEKRFR